MRFLALDTAMAACSVAVLDSERAAPLAARGQAMERGHAEALPPMVEAAMRETGLAYADLERIVVTIGPGTFTGLRIGLSFARGLGLALGIPVIGIDTLRAISANHPLDSKPLLVAADARRDEVYAALYDADRAVQFPPMVVRIADLLPKLPAGALTAIGSGADAVIAASGRADISRSAAGDLPDARTFAFAAALPATGRMPDPLYLRAPDAKPQAPAARRLSAPTFTSASPALLAALHAASFDAPWTEQSFAEMLAAPGTGATIAALSDEPAGFIVSRRAADEAEVITIGVRPELQRRGIARALLNHELGELSGKGAMRCFIEVAVSNAPARALYEGSGFRQVGLRRAYYERPGGAREDALVMAREFSP